MALRRYLADGTEQPCHKCGRDFRPGEMKTQRPSMKPGLPGAFTVGGKSYVWVHEGCGPQRTKTHKHVKTKRR